MPASVLKGVNWARWLLALFFAYSLYLLWTNFTAQERIRASTLTEYRLQAEKRAAALTDFLAARRADVQELAESSEMNGYFTNLDLQMSLEYGLRFNLMAIEARLARAIAGKQIAGAPIYDAMILADDSGRVLASAGALPPEGTALQRYLTPRSKLPAIWFDTAPDRVVASAPVFHKNRLVGMLVGLVGIARLGRYYTHGSQSPGHWDESLVDAQGLPVFATSPYQADIRRLASRVKAMDSGSSRQIQAGRGGPEHDLLLV